MSLHKLTAGSGYDYLTRQVAALDATGKGHVGLAAYYTERGESPGAWLGSGLAGIEGVDGRDPVTAEQMRNLFGCGLHPLADVHAQQFEGSDLTLDTIEKTMRLGTPFRVVDEATPFRVEVAKRIADLNAMIGAPADAEVAASSRARIRTEVAKEFFHVEHGRDPVDARELAAQIAKDSRPRSQTVAGYDLTFSPVKSVSTLWAVADPSTAAAIERAHRAAVADALRFIEKQALFTRTGPRGILVDLLVSEVLEHRSVALKAPSDGIEEPDDLRRADGSSVYAIAGADRYSSQRILDAERRILTAAGRHDGAAVDASAVELALLEMAANGTMLDAGQAALVRRMCTSGARVELAIAPAGAGKTTAMRALTQAWTQDGGQVIGLAPSAAAAAVLAEHTGIRADTVAKLTWALQHHDLPDWAAHIDRHTLIIIDEAGMADTLSLDTAIHYAIDRGASVRLIGDDQQLAAIGNGGILRDIKHTHGGIRLTELHRFADPTEAQASLALRDGDPRALGFYLDPGRVHVGDLAKITEDAFAAWISDRAAGLDAIMLAPTRDSSLSSTAAPVIIVATVPRPGTKCVWGTETARVSET
jgi:AAA domain/TrwC relaxase